jgi:hypothetical protein
MVQDCAGATVTVVLDVRLLVPSVALIVKVVSEVKVPDEVALPEAATLVPDPKEPPEIITEVQFEVSQLINVVPLYATAEGLAENELILQATVTETCAVRLLVPSVAFKVKVVVVVKGPLDVLLPVLATLVPDPKEPPEIVTEVQFEVFQLKKEGLLYVTAVGAALKELILQATATVTCAVRLLVPSVAFKVKVVLAVKGPVDKLLPVLATLVPDPKEPPEIVTEVQLVVFQLKEEELLYATEVGVAVKELIPILQVAGVTKFKVKVKLPPLLEQDWEYDGVTLVYIAVVPPL